MARETYAEFQARTGAGTMQPGQTLPPDVMAWLQVTGAAQQPQWQRVINGENPIGGGPGYRTSTRTATTRVPVYDGVPTQGVQDPMGPTSGGRRGGGGTFGDSRGTRLGSETVTGPVTRYDSAVYFDGDAQSEYQKMNNDRRARVKQQMRDLGLLSEGGGGPGSMWDSNAVNAFEELLAYSNNLGVSWRVGLSAMKTQSETDPEWQNARAKANQGPTLPAFTPDVSNPDDLRKVFEQAAIKIIGKGGANPDLVERFVQTYQQQQIDSQRAAYDATYAINGNTTVGPGGTVVQEPDANVAAETLIRDANPTESGGMDIRNTMGSFLKIIGVQDVG